MVMLRWSSNPNTFAGQTNTKDASRQDDQILQTPDSAANYRTQQLPAPYDELLGIHLFSTKS